MISIGGHLVRVKVMSVHGKTVRLGIDAPKQVNVVRSELIGKESDRERN
jgi:carbon storage regulator CsrA